MRILLCDDHSVFADALAVLLEREGHTVVAVTTRPTAAVEFLRDSPADVCLLDCSFPDELGLDHVEELRAVAPDCRIVLLSAQLDADTVTRGVALRVNGFARKQRPLAELLMAITRVAAGELALPDDLLVATLSARRSDPRPGGPGGNPVREYCRFFTQRERDVLRGIVAGHGTAEMATEMGVSTATARGYVQSVLTKLGVHTRHKAAVLAVREGVVSAETGRWLLE